MGISCKLMTAMLVLIAVNVCAQSRDYEENCGLYEKYTAYLDFLKVYSKKYDVAVNQRNQRGQSN